jgi:chromosome segregation ATPase
MADAPVGIVRAIFRFFQFWNWRKARGIIDAADRQFTGSVDGITAAFDIHQDQLVKQFQSLRNAVAQVEGILEDKRQRLAKLNDEEHDLLRKREGALALAEQAKGKDPAEYDKHAAAFERFQTRIEEIETLQHRLDAEVGDTSKTMSKHMLQLQEMQSELSRLSQQKAEAIADFVSARQIVELNDRLQGLESSLDRGPIAAVLEANRQLTARARISEKLAGVDVKVQEREYAQAGREATAHSKLEEMLAARKAEREAAAKPAERDKDDRPKI